MCGGKRRFHASQVDVVALRPVHCSFQAKMLMCARDTCAICLPNLHHFEYFDTSFCFLISTALLPKNASTNLADSCPYSCASSCSRNNISFLLKKTRKGFSHVHMFKSVQKTSEDFKLQAQPWRASQGHQPLAIECSIRIMAHSSRAQRQGFEPLS